MLDRIQTPLLRSLAATLALSILACSSPDRAAGPHPSATAPPSSNPVPGATRLRVLAAPSVLIQGTTASSWAWIREPSGNERRATDVVWESSLPAVATIVARQDGVARIQARTPGVATISVYGPGTDTVRYSITVAVAPQELTALERSPIVVSSFKVMYREEDDGMYFTPLAMIAARAREASVIRMDLVLPGILPAPGCSMARHFTQSAPLIGKIYGFWELEISTSGRSLPTSAPILQLMVLDAEGSLYRVEVPGELMPFDPELEWPSAFPGGLSCS